VYNTRIVEKIRDAAELGNTERVRSFLSQYDILIHPRHFWLHAVAPASTQIEYYEVQIARYISWTGESLHFIERVVEQDDDCKRHILRKLGFVGEDGEKSVKRYWEVRKNVQEWCNYRYHNHRIKHGSAASEAYRSGFMEAVLDRVRYKERTAEYYRKIFHLVKFRDIITPSRRELSDQAARSAGLDDGLVTDLGTLNLPFHVGRVD